MNNNTSLIIKNLIRCEYSMRADILANICNHIDNLNRDNIIHHTCRNKLMNIVNNCVLTLNTNYNDSLPLHTEIVEKYEPTVIEKKFIDNLNISAYNKYISIGNTRKEITKYFEVTDKTIYELLKTIGSLNISDIFKLIIGPDYRSKMGIDSDVNNITEYTKYIQSQKTNITLREYMKTIHNSAALIDALIKNFVPVEMYFCDNTFKNKKTSVLINKYKHDKIVNSEESTKFKFEVMLENCYKITIKCARTDNVFTIYGFFSYDAINTVISTSQICNNYIYYKKKLLIDYVREHANINKDYKDYYLANLSLGDVLSSKGDQLVNKLLSDFELYTKSCHIKFKVTVNDFLKSDLTKKYNILRSLLLGQKNSIKNAAMLFGMTKDQNRDSKNNKSCVADILFRNLNYAQQSKIRKSGQYIKQELDRIKKMTLDDMDYKQQCAMNNNMSDYVKKCVLSRLDEMKNNNSEYHKNLLYVKTLIEYPWVSDDYCDVFTTIGNDINKCREKLKSIKEDFDSRVFGQTEFKTVICDIIGKWFSNPNSMGKAIGLQGPPGCGKTLIASGLGKVIGVPFQEIHLGGLEDGSVLNGHSFTYSGAQPGLIVTKMVMAGEPRCVLFFDELDKACAKHGTNEIFNVLIHATDPNTNSKFSDKFFQDVTFPLNKCIFVFSFNDESKIDPILKDRMEIIRVSPYSMTDKIEISKKHLIPELLDGVGIERDSIILTQNTLEYIIDKYTLEAGVRKLRNCIEKIFLKLNVDRIYGRGPFKNRNNFSKEKPIRIMKNHVVKYLGKSKSNVEKIHSTNQIGVVNGLYATTMGSGGIIPILCYPNRHNNKFSLVMTGKQGKVMKESVNFSWTIAKNCVKPDYVNAFYKSNAGGIHIHTPEGAVPKDGPSAGCAFTTAFISRIVGFPIKKDIAMTGEITIGGDITAIGGLEYKLTGAKIAGVKLVFVCEQNLDDVKKIKETNPALFNIVNHNNNPKVAKVISETCKKKNSNVGDFKVFIVNTVYDIIPYALIDFEYVKTNNIQILPDSQTCDINKFMLKHENGFDNNVDVMDTIIINNYNDFNNDSDKESDTDNDNND